MRRVWNGLATLTALMGLTGCPSRDHLKPPTPPEVYAVPPADDQRYAGPPNYPAGTLNRDDIHKNSVVDTPGAFHAGGGPRGGGGGGGGGGGAGMAGGSY